MPEWEYCHIILVPGLPFGWSCASPENDYAIQPNTFSNRGTLQEFYRFLGKLGDEGWEMITHTIIPPNPVGTSTYHYYTFKRLKAKA